MPRCSVRSALAHLAALSDDRRTSRQRRMLAVLAGRGGSSAMAAAAGMRSPVDTRSRLGPAAIAQ